MQKPELEISNNTKTILQAETIIQLLQEKTVKVHDISYLIGTHKNNPASLQLIKENLEKLIKNKDENKSIHGDTLESLVKTIDIQIEKLKQNQNQTATDRKSLTITDEKESKLNHEELASLLLSSNISEFDAFRQLLLFFKQTNFNDVFLILTKLQNVLVNEKANPQLVNLSMAALIKSSLQKIADEIEGYSTNQPSIKEIAFVDIKPALELLQQFLIKPRAIDIIHFLYQDEYLASKNQIIVKIKTTLANIANIYNKEINKEPNEKWISFKLHMDDFFSLILKILGSSYETNISDENITFNTIFSLVGGDHDPSGVLKKTSSALKNLKFSWSCYNAYTERQYSLVDLVHLFLNMTNFEDDNQNSKTYLRYLLYFVKLRDHNQIYLLHKLAQVKQNKIKLDKSYIDEILCQKEITKTFIERCNFFDTDNNNKTPLAIAVEKTNLPFIRFILRSTAQNTQKSDQIAKSLFDLAAENDNKAVLNLLIKLINKEKVFEWAVDNDDTGIIKILIPDCTSEFLNDIYNRLKTKNSVIANILFKKLHPRDTITVSQNLSDYSFLNEKSKSKKNLYRKEVSKILDSKSSMDKNSDGGDLIDSDETDIPSAKI